jgi:sugar phosphate isomerase/epimerase
MFPNLNAHNIGVKTDFVGTLDLAAKHGFPGVDFSITEAQQLVDAHGVDHIYRLLESKGLRLGSWGMPVDFRNDEAKFEQGLAQLDAQAALAKELCCYRCATWIMPCSDTLPFAENYKIHRNRLRAIAEILAKHEIRFGLEFVGPKTLRDTRKYPFLHSIDGMLALCADIDTGNMGLLVDLYHVYTSHATIDDVRKLSAADVVTVHINDAVAGLPIDELLDQVRALPAETGVTDIGGFLNALNHIGYDGPVTSEPFSQRVRDLPADAAVAETAAAMHKSWQIAGISW